MPNNELPDRLLHLRAKHPDLEVETETVKLDDKAAVFKARVAIPGRGSSSGHGSSTADEGDGFVELAENRAMYRALQGLGVGFALQDANQVAQILPMDHPGSEEHESLRTPESLTTPDSATQDSKNPEKYSWSAFWAWAKELEFHSKEEIEEYVGQSVTRMRPAEVRELILSVRSRQSDPDVGREDITSI